MSKNEINVNTRPGASQYDRGNEQTIEFSSPVGGGLISFVITSDDQLQVHIYRHDLTVSVSAGEAGEPVRSGNLRADEALYRAAKAFIAGWESRNPSPGRLTRTS